MLFDTLMLQSFGLSLEKEKRADGYRIIPMLKFAAKKYAEQLSFGTSSLGVILYHNFREAAGQLHVRYGKHFQS